MELISGSFPVSSSRWKVRDKNLVPRSKLRFMWTDGPGLLYSVLILIKHPHILASCTKFNLFRNHLKWWVPDLSQRQERKGVSVWVLALALGKGVVTMSLVLSSHQEQAATFLGPLYCHDSHPTQGCLTQAEKVSVSNVNKDWLIPMALWKWKSFLIRYMSTFQLSDFCLLDTFLGWQAVLK